MDQHGQRMDKRIQICLTEAEEKLFTDKATRAGMKTSNFIRMCALRAIGAIQLDIFK